AGRLGPFASAIACAWCEGRMPGRRRSSRSSSRASCVPSCSCPRNRNRCRWKWRLRESSPFDPAPSANTSPTLDLSVTLGRLTLRNPILVASGTFGYAREMAGLVDFARLGGIIPKTVTHKPRKGNPPPRTVETPSGMLNAIGLDNDGIDHFIAHHL